MFRFATMLSQAARLSVLLVAAPVLALLATAILPDADQQGLGVISHLVQTVLPRYLLTTVWLGIVVLVVSLLIGVRSAWLIAAYDFPGRAWLSPALVLPLAMPAFVMAYAYTDFLEVAGPVQTLFRELTGLRVREYWFPEVRTTFGAGVFLALALYPYIYLMGRAAFAERPATLDEAARTLGASSRSIWWRVVLPVARPAIAAGAMLVLMETLADFGVVSYFSVDSFTAGIYRAWQSFGDRVAAARLAIVLLALVGLVVFFERKQRGRMQFVARGQRRIPRQVLTGARAWRATVTCMAPVFFGFVLPAGILFVGWLDDGAQLDYRVPSWIYNSIRLALLGALVTVPAGLMAAYAIRMAPTTGTRVAIAIANGGYALPGTVLAIGLLLIVGLFDRWIWHPIFETALLANTVFAVVYAYLVRFFSVSFQGMDAGLRRISQSMDDSARSLGRSPVRVLIEVHWPLLRRSLSVTTLLVTIECLKELPATLVLRPFNTDTLAVIAYQFASDERLSQAALPSLLIVLIGIAPVLMLGRTALRE